MEKLTLDSMIAEMPEAAATIVKKVLGDRDAKILAHEASIRAHEATIVANKSAMDKQQATLDSAQAELKAAQDPTKFQTAVAARVGLESGARKILGESADLTKLNERQIKVAVVGKLAPALNCDGKSDDYVNAAYEIHTASAQKGNAASEVVTAQINNGQAKVLETKVTADAVEDPMAKLVKEAGTSKPWTPNQK